MTSMFGNLAARFAPSAENLATEALAYILRRSPAARRALNNFAAVLCPNLQKVQSFRTQYAENAEAIPDLAGFDQYGENNLLIENKFWAGLTPNQPVAYLERLPVYAPGLLLFVVPPRRLYSIWPDLAVSAAQAGLSLPAPDASRANALCCQIENHFLGVTSWQALLDQIEAEAQASGEAITVSDVGQLRGLCEQMNLTGYVPATLEELTNAAVPRRILGLAELVRQVCERAVATKIADAKLLRPTHYWYGAGRYLRIGAAGAWVGIDHRLWAQYGIGPLWIIFASNEFGRATEVLREIAPWLSANPVKAFDWDGSAVIPLRITPLAIPEVVLEDIYTQLVDINRMIINIPSAGSPTLSIPAEDNS